MHALVIEDEFLTAQLIEDRLRELGFTTFAFAMDEEEAVTAARERCPDLIASDVELLSGCGIDAVRRICAEKSSPSYTSRDRPRLCASAARGRL